MNISRVTAFAVGGLEFVFTPPGLPLVEKSAGVPTTSVLIRGAAGTGKSTLALAVAHAVAKATDGIVLYLVTEASLSDVRHKAQLLRLAGPVARFDPAQSFEVGAIAVSHLVIEHSDLHDGPGGESDAHAVMTASS